MNKQQIIDVCGGNDTGLLTVILNSSPLPLSKLALHQTFHWTYSVPLRASHTHSLKQRLIPRYDDASIDMTTQREPPPWLMITLVVLYYILYPVLLLFKALWYILLLLSTPIIYIGRVVLAMSLIPWRMFTRFEVRHAQIAA